MTSPTHPGPVSGEAKPMSRRARHQVQLQAMLDALKQESFNAGIERAAVLIESHSCVSSCCDAQPSGGEAAELAKCVRKLKGKPCPE